MPITRVCVAYIGIPYVPITRVGIVYMYLPHVPITRVSIAHTGTPNMPLTIVDHHAWNPLCASNEDALFSLTDVPIARVGSETRNISVVQFAALESGDVDDDMAALRKEMLGSSKVRNTGRRLGWGTA